MTAPLTGTRPQVLILASDYQPAVSGVGVYVEQLSAHLSPIWDINIAAPGALFDDKRLTFRRLPTSKSSSFSTARLIEWSSLMGFLSGHAKRPDIIHAHGFMSAVPAALASEAWGVPWVLTKHCWLEHYDNAPQIAYDLQAWAVSNAHKVVTPSKWLARRIHNEVGRSIEVEIIYSDSEVPHSVTALSTETPGRIFIHSGAQYHKGVDLSIQAFLQGAGKQDRLLILGTLEEHLRGKLESIQDERITWLGQQTQQQAWEYYAQATALLAPSRSDGLPLAIIEAQKIGIPILGTDGSSIPEIITNGVTGICVPQEDFPTLVAEFSRSTLTSAEEISRITKDRFSWTTTAAKYNQLLSSLAF